MSPRIIGANLVVTPEADSLPLEIGGIDFRPANSGAYLPESDLPKIKSVFWHNNITAFAPTLRGMVPTDLPPTLDGHAAIPEQLHRTILVIEPLADRLGDHALYPRPWSFFTRAPRIPALP